MPQWSEPHQWPALGAGEVHVWLAHLPSQHPYAKRLAEVLSPEELGRASRFRFEALRERARLTRGLLRLVLSHYLGARPGDIAFGQRAHGKPVLEHPSSDLFFNVSHSGEYAAWALTRLGHVGVDIEQVRDDMSGREEIARRHFAPGEQEQLSALPASEQIHGFFDLWSRKEAFVKARGDGLSSGLDQFEVSLATPCLRSVGDPSDHAAHWWMAALPPLPGYAGAVVVRATSCSPRFWNWSARLIDQRPSRLFRPCG